jgi:2OG-Fe(II) oxygenase superfamily
MLDPCMVSPFEPRGSRLPACSALDLLERRLALRCPGALAPSECASQVAAVVAARASWTSNFGGKQFTLGRAYYTHLEEGREAEYFEAAGSSDALVRATVPSLQEHMLSLAARVLGAAVTPRLGWCGPGVHIFPARGEVARRGGEVHFDTEGLTPLQVERRVPAVSMVLMLQRPESGGGLRVWERSYEGEDFPDKPDPNVPVTQIAYDVGELVVFDSYRLHQILPFLGRVDRISATMHACLEDGVWQSWF